MKIAFIAHVFPRLHNTYILNEIVELINQGHDVHVFSIHRSKETTINEDVKNYQLAEKTYYFEDYLDENSNSRREFELYEPYFKNKIFAFKKMAEKIKSEEFDILHGILGNRPATAAMVLSELSLVPFSFEAHAYDLFVDFPFAKEKINKACFIATESHYNKDFFVNALCAPCEKINIVHLAPNKPMLDKTEKKDRIPNLIVSASRLHPIKGISQALKAVARVQTKIPDVKYIVMGDGPLRAELVNESLALGLEEISGFTSDITNERVCSIIAQASIFLLPCVIDSSGDRDGTPTAITEALYLETPVVSSRLSGIPELVDDGVNGILTEPGNIVQIAEALLKLLSDKPLREKMGRAGKDKIEREFNIHKSVEELVRLWKNALSVESSEITN